MSNVDPIGSNAGVTPWTSDEVERLLVRQADRNLHPYTCGDHPDVQLVPTVDGWICPRLAHLVVQRWAHTHDLGRPYPEGRD